MTEQEQKAFDQMRETLEEIICAHPVTSTMRQVHAIVAGRNALAAANAVSHTKPETTPLPEGGAITSESAANAVQPQAQGEWKHCTPELLSSGVSCKDTPRRPCECEHGGSHDHWIAHPQATEPQAQVKLNPADLVFTVEVQHMGGFARVNTSGVRVTHVPTGISVVSTRERSRHANRQIAIDCLKKALAATPEAP
ncbi:peptide chain release factor family protein [Rhodoferax mekongensis]|uniref:Peptide chain release factor-like protein n=1 Tax=Rhodoferax mekongensis TaxID=3068341 RepID=A0ABZ0B2S4_9BURK|nr:peptide chain release factor-like protein [Rhodoferax sp. TBRC 17307]WNO05994.1 peptide chain release factor-like protein [Rhodoferax sp. TBRC 17307]